MDFKTISTEQSAFQCLDQCRKENHRLTPDELLDLGQGLSSSFFQGVQGVFGAIRFVKDAVHNYFSNRAVEVIQKYNWSIVTERFHPNKEEEGMLRNLLPIKELLLDGSESFKDIEKRHNYYSFCQKLRSNDPNEVHWLHSLSEFGDIEWELEILLENENFHCIENLNEQYSENKDWLSHKAFGMLVKKTLGDRQLSQLNDEDVKKISESIDFCNTQPFLQGKLEGRPEFIEVLPEIVKKFTEQLDQYAARSHNPRAFMKYCEEKSDLFGASPEEVSKNLGRAFEEFHKEQFERFMKESQILLPKLEKYGLKTYMQGLLKGLPLNGPSSRKVLEFPFTPSRLQAKINRLEGIYLKFNPVVPQKDYFVFVQKEIKKLLDEKVPLEEAFDRVAHNMENFILCLPYIISPKDTDDVKKLYEFYSDVTSKGLYNSEIISKALQKLIEKKGISKVVGGAIGGLGSRLSLTFLSDEEKEFITLCFSYHAQKIAKEECTKRGINYSSTIQNTMDEVVSLFANRDVVPNKESIAYLSDFFRFVAQLGLDNHPASSIQKVLSLKKKSFCNLDVESIKDQKLKPLAFSLKKTISDEVALDAKKAQGPEKKFEDIGSAIQNNPTRLISTLGSAFIEQLLPEHSPKQKKQIAEAIDSFAPIINPLLSESDFVKDLNDRPSFKMMISSIFAGASGLSKEILNPLLEVLKIFVKEQIVLESKSGIEGPIQWLVSNITEANALFRKAKKEGTKLEDLEIPKIQKWLLLGLHDLSEKKSLISTLSSAVPSFIQSTAGVTGFLSGKAIGLYVWYILKDNTDLTNEEKSNMRNGAETLANILLPIVPKIKENHNLDLYTQFIKDIDSIVRSDTPADGHEIVEKLQAVMAHFLDEELDHYKDPVYAALQNVPSLLD